MWYDMVRHFVVRYLECGMVFGRSWCGTVWYCILLVKYVVLYGMVFPISNAFVRVSQGLAITSHLAVMCLQGIDDEYP